MKTAHNHSLQSLFSTEHDCVVYLFKRRWPNGFICPFCENLQQDIAPAYNVVCRYCRKQTSITAHTLMHGSKNSLLSWMLISWQFCRKGPGISAREIQRRMELSNYQTAWRWLQKLRGAAAIAESAPYSGTVLFLDQPKAMIRHRHHSSLATLVQLNSLGTEVKKIRLIILTSLSHSLKINLFLQFITKGSVVITYNSQNYQQDLPSYRFEEPNSKHQRFSMETIHDCINWLSATYRKNLDGDYLQSYLDEYSFRFNTAEWKDQLTVFEHLVTGLLATVKHSPLLNIESPQDNFCLLSSGDLA